VEERQMMTDCVVVGAGPAGTPRAPHSVNGVADHVILEHSQGGDNWRTQRWDSFRVNTPGWMNQLLGEQERYAYADRAEVVQKLEQLANNSPIRAGVRMARLAPAGDGDAMRTSDGEFRSRTVVVTTGQKKARIHGS
jgi:putative flavoprotein involved in K+ transport